MDSDNAVVFRRFMHFSMGLILFYYLLPDLILGIPKNYCFVGLFIILPIVIEILRLSSGKSIFGLREHEKDHVASYVWFTSGAVILLIFFPQQIAAPCILGASIGDPILGITRNLRRRYTFSITYIILFLIFMVFHYYDTLVNFIIAGIASGILLISESLEFRIKWELKPHLFYSRSKKTISRNKRFFEFLFKTDDDFIMQIVTAVSLLIIYTIIGWHYMPPELLHVSPTIAGLLG